MSPVKLSRTFQQKKDSNALNSICESGINIHHMLAPKRDDPGSFGLCTPMRAWRGFFFYWGLNLIGPMARGNQNN